MATLQIEGIKFHYQEFGKGLPLVCIMGLGANLDFWSGGLIESLSKFRRVIVFDNRGVGDSGGGEQAFSIASMAADTIALMDALNIAKADIFGVSMGGMIGQELAISFGHRVDRLILACTNMGARHMRIPFALFPTAFARLGQKRLRNILFPLEYQLQHAERVDSFMKRAMTRPIKHQILQKQLKACLLFSSKARLGNIRAPTLLITGDQDILVDKANSMAIAKRIQGAELEIYQGGGHGFMLQFTDRVLARIQTFLLDDHLLGKHL